MIPCALVLALDNAGKSNAARIAMMAITTRSSISVKARMADPCLPREGRRTAKGFVIEQIFDFVVWGFARFACVSAIVNVSLLLPGLCDSVKSSPYAPRLERILQKMASVESVRFAAHVGLFGGTCSHNQSSGIRLAVRTDSILQAVGGVGRVFSRRDPQLFLFRNCQGADDFGRRTQDQGFRRNSLSLRHQGVGANETSFADHGAI